LRSPALDCVSLHLLASGLGAHVFPLFDFLGRKHPGVVVFAQQFEQRVVAEIGGIEQPSLLVGLAHQQSFHLKQKARFPPQNFDYRGDGQRNPGLQVPRAGFG
jgi:hypothetical protein